MANQFFLLIESARIRTAFAYDPQFAVSLSEVRPLPHQLEAVYERILPQVRLRFLLADDPGAGKTIMAGLLLDELRSKFSETFEVINSILAKGQLAGDSWERFYQCIAPIDFAKRDDVSPGILQVDWDLVIIDEAHKCSAQTQGDDLRRTGRYKMAEGTTVVELLGSLRTFTVMMVASERWMMSAAERPMKEQLVVHTKSGETVTSRPIA